MIISHSRQFILVKSRKTASSSLQAAIVPMLTKEDIWTPMSLPPLDGQNYYSYWPFDFLSAKSAFFRNLIGRDNSLHRWYFHDHISLNNIKRFVSQSQFSNYYKIAFDRNPWDCIVSLYFFEKRKKAYSTWDFDRFLHEYPIIQNWDLYTHNNIVQADDVYRYEDIQAAIGIISTKTGLALERLPNAKRSYRDGSDYRSFYSASSRDLVAQRWSSTIALLNYDF